MKTLEQLLEEHKENINDNGLESLWNEGHNIVLGEEAQEVFKSILNNILTWAKQWNDDVEKYAVRDELDQLHMQVRKELKTIKVPEDTDIDRLAIGYMFAIYSGIFKDEKFLEGYTQLDEQARKNIQEINIYLQSGEEGLEKRQEMKEGTSSMASEISASEESESVEEALIYKRTVLRDGLVIAEKEYDGSTKDEVKLEERYEYPETPSMRQNQDDSPVAAMIGSNFVWDQKHHNEVLDSYSDINVFNADGTLRATVIAVTDGFGHYQSSENNKQIVNAANRISHEFTNYMAANVEQIENFIRKGDVEGYNRFVKGIVKAIQDEYTLGYEETASLSCSMLVKVDEKFYQASVNIGDGVVWKIDHDATSVSSVVKSRNYGEKKEAAAPPAFHTAFYGKDPFNKNPLNFDVDIETDFGEVKENDAIFVGSDAQMDAVMTEIEEAGGISSNEVTKHRMKFEYDLPESVGKSLYEKAEINSGDSANTMLQKFFQYAVDYVNAERVKEDVTKCGDDHTGAIKKVGEVFSLKLEETLDVGHVERVDQETMGGFVIDPVKNPNKYFYLFKDDLLTPGKVLKSKMVLTVDVLKSLIKNHEINNESDIYNIGGIVTYQKNAGLEIPEKDLKKMRDIVENKIADYAIKACAEGKAKELCEQIRLINTTVLFSQTEPIYVDYADERVDENKSPTKKDILLRLQNVLTGLEIDKVDGKILFNEENSELRKKVFGLLAYAASLPTEEEVLRSKGSKAEGLVKRNEIIGLCDTIFKAESKEEISNALEGALTSTYDKAHQKNPLLVNRGTHFYWMHSLAAGKRNTVSGNRLSRSKTEDLLLDVKEAADKAVDKDIHGMHKIEF